MMVSRTLARRYAIALYGVNSERGGIERTGESLSRMTDAIDADDAARAFFLAPTIDRNDKERALAAVFEGRVDEVALHAVLLLVRKHRERLLHLVLEEYRALEKSGAGVEMLTIASARPLGPKEISDVRKRLERVFGRRFEPRVLTDPTLVGGVRVALGDRVIDGTIAGRIDELARTLRSAS
ncbi:MAG: ATP synthase F1 subunit delta [Candidatus Tyrphobacter sp.]